MPHNMPKLKILVADDHELVRVGIVSLLETEDNIAVVGEAADGEEALKKSIKVRPDVILMDLMMPILDGVSATEKILKQLPGCKILIMTTSTASDDLANARDSGAHGVITKNGCSGKCGTVSGGMRSVQLRKVA